MGRLKAARYSTNGGHLLPRMRRAVTLPKHVSDPTRTQVITMLSKGERYTGPMSGMHSESTRDESPRPAA